MAENVEGPRSFAVFMQQVEDGQFHTDVSAELQKLNQQLAERAAQTSGKAKGKLTISFEITHEHKGVVGIECDFATKAPRPPRSRSIMFATKGGNLATENPRQAKLPLRGLDGGEGPARDLGPNAASARDV